MTRPCFVTLAAILALAAGVAGLLAVAAKPISYDLPEETAALEPGPGVEAAQGNCTACHSADYIKTQPRGPGFEKDFWQAEVTKMIKAYGAPIDERDAGKIVDYLAATY
jgi:sulfite dehydrogenase (cytochrome) subunit B